MFAGDSKRLFMAVRRSITPIVIAILIGCLGGSATLLAQSPLPANPAQPEWQAKIAELEKRIKELEAARPDEKKPAADRPNLLERQFLKATTAPAWFRRFTATRRTKRASILPLPCRNPDLRQCRFLRFSRANPSECGRPLFPAWMTCSPFPLPTDCTLYASRAKFSRTTTIIRATATQPTTIPF